MNISMQSESSLQVEKDPWNQVKWINSPEIESLPIYTPSWEGWKQMDHAELNALKENIDQYEQDGTWEMRKKLANP